MTREERFMELFDRIDDRFIKAAGKTFIRDNIVKLDVIREGSAERKMPGHLKPLALFAAAAAIVTGTALFFRSIDNEQPVDTDTGIIITLEPDAASNAVIEYIPDIRGLKWGMSADEVREFEPETLAREEENVSAGVKETLLIYDDVAFSGYTARMELCITEGRGLDGVNYHIPSDDPDALFDTLYESINSEYGESTDEYDAIMFWEPEGKPFSIMLLKEDGGVQYSFFPPFGKITDSNDYTEYKYRIYYEDGSTLSVMCNENGGTAIIFTDSGGLEQVLLEYDDPNGSTEIFEYEEDGGAFLVLALNSGSTALPAAIAAVSEDGSPLILSDLNDKDEFGIYRGLYYLPSEKLVCRLGSSIYSGSANIIPYHWDNASERFVPFKVEEITADELNVLDKDNIIPDKDKIISVLKRENGFIHVNYNEVYEAEINSDIIASRTYISENGRIENFLKYNGAPVYFSQALTVTEAETNFGYVKLNDGVVITRIYDEDAEIPEAIDGLPAQKLSVDQGENSIIYSKTDGSEGE